MCPTAATRWPAKYTQGCPSPRQATPSQYFRHLKSFQGFLTTRRKKKKKKRRKNVKTRHFN